GGTKGNAASNGPGPGAAGPGRGALAALPRAAPLVARPALGPLAPEAFDAVAPGAPRFFDAAAFTLAAAERAGAAFSAVRPDLRAGRFVARRSSGMPVPSLRTMGPSCGPFCIAASICQLKRNMPEGEP